MLTVTLSGNLGRDADVRQTPNGKDVTNLSVGVTPRVKKNGDWVDAETMWFNVTVWQALPPALYSKGQTVVVSGDLTQRTYEKDGVSRTNLEISNAVIGVMTKVNKGHNEVINFADARGAATWSEAPQDDMPF